MSFPESYPIIQELESLETLKQEFDMTLEEGVKSGNFENTQILQHQLEIRRDGLRDRLNPFERMINLREQYNSQRKILEHTGVLASLSSGERGITDIDGNEWPMPSYEEILKRMKNKKEILSEKVEQGFGKLLVVPFGMSLDYLSNIYSNALLVHHAQGEFFKTKKDPNEADIKLNLYRDDPFYTGRGFSDSEDLVYYPKKFDRDDHGGKTKEQLLEEEQTGWHVLLIEDMPNIPRLTESITDVKTIGGRTQIDSSARGMRPFVRIEEKFPNAHEYLKGLQESPMYLHEQGFTPEDQIMYALSYLEETNHVLDCASEGIPETLLLGAYSKWQQNEVPAFFWGPISNQMLLEVISPLGRSWNMGIRTSVKI